MGSKKVDISKNPNSAPENAPDRLDWLIYRVQEDDDGISKGWMMFQLSDLKRLLSKDK
jgi:hypothetical protein